MIWLKNYDGVVLADEARVTSPLLVIASRSFFFVVILHLILIQAFYLDVKKYFSY